MRGRERTGTWHAGCNARGMIAPASGSEWSPQHLLPSDGAGPIGPDQHWPQPSGASFGEVLGALNPLHHLPGVGMIYRAVTGETIPPALSIAGAAAVGGPVGLAGAVLMNLVGELFRLGPDTSRPAAPAGMQATGSEAPMAAVTPGTLEEGQYTTLATSTPAFLQSPVLMADDGRRGYAAYYAAANEWQRANLVEKGLA